MIEQKYELKNGIIIHTVWHSFDRASVIITSYDWSTNAQADFASQLSTAARLGYGNDVGQMTVDHDPLHAVLAYTLGRQSYSLLWASGIDRRSATLAQGMMEEAAVMELQKLLRLEGLTTYAWACDVGAVK